MIYFLIVIVATMFAALATYCRDCKCGFWLFAAMSFSAITIPAVLRYGIGTDYLLVYVPAINWTMQGALTDQEHSFRLVVETIMRFTEEPHWVFVFYSVATYIIALTAFPKKGFQFAVLFYLLQYYPFTLCDIRQGLALSFVLWIVIMYMTRHVVWMIVLGIVSSYWHLSAAMMFAVLAVAHYLSRKTIKNFYLVVAIAGVLLLEIDLSEVFLKLASFTPYAKYLFHPEFIDSAHTTTGLGYLIPALMYYCLAVTIYNMKRSTRMARFLGIACGIAFLTGVTSLHLEIFRRFSIITDSVLPIATAYIWRKRSSLLDYGCLFLVFMCILALFSKEILSGGGYGVVPYATIFDEGVQLW